MPDDQSVRAFPQCTRRQAIRMAAGAAGAAALGLWPESAEAGRAPSTPVAVGRCQSYRSAEVARTLVALIDQAGGIRKLVGGKTVTVKVNLTGGVFGYMAQPPGMTHHTHPAVVRALASILRDAGARRIRIVESAQFRGPLEEFLARAGWDVPALRAAGGTVEFENTRNRGSGKTYALLKVPGGGLVYPGYRVNRVYEDTEVVVSVGKMKAHTVTGVTLSMKNMFGITPNALYGDDAGSEGASDARMGIVHFGWRNPPSGVPAQLDTLSHKPGLRVPRVVTDLVRARPIDVCVIDGVSAQLGAEGPWAWPLRTGKPNLLIVGTNPVCTDAVAAAAMGYDPQGKPGTGPYAGENHLALGAAAGIGTNDLQHIEVRGLTIREARFPYGKVSREEPPWSRHRD